MKSKKPIKAVVYALEFHRNDASNDVIDALENIRQHSTGTLSDSDTLIFYIGMATCGEREDRFTFDVDGNAFPHARHKEHQTEPYQKSTEHLHSKQAIKILDDAGIAWTCRVLEQYPDDDTDSIHEEMYRLKFISQDMPIMNTISGLSKLPEGAIDVLSKCSTPAEYKQRKQNLSQPRGKYNHMKRVIWDDNIQFSDEEKQFIVDEFKVYLEQKYLNVNNKPQGYASMMRSTEDYLFNQRKLNRWLINAKEAKRIITQIISNAGYYSDKPIQTKPYDQMTPDEQLAWHEARTDDDWETPGAEVARRTRGR